METDQKRLYSKKRKIEKPNEGFEECSRAENGNVEENLSYKFVDIDSDFSECDDMDLPIKPKLAHDNGNNHSVHEMTNQNATSDSSSSEEEFVYEAADSREIHELQEWIISANIPHKYVDQLLKILRRRLLPSFPKHAKALLNCKLNSSTIEKMAVSNSSSDGEFTDFKLNKQSPCEIALRVDGTSSFKSSPAAKFSMSNSDVSENQSNTKDNPKKDERINQMQNSNTSDDKLINMQNTIISNPDGVFSNINKTDIIDVPIIHFDNVECKTQFETAVIMKLNQLSSDVAQLLKKQDALVEEVHSLKAARDLIFNFSTDKVQASSFITDLKEKYKLKIPLDTHQDFEAFEEKLQIDKFFKNDVYNVLQSLTDKEFSISRSIVKMLKKFLTKELALQFTAIRSSPINKTKYKFRPSQLCAMMEAVIVKMRSEKSFITEQEDFNGSLSDVFTNVCKWRS